MQSVHGVTFLWRKIWWEFDPSLLHYSYLCPLSSLRLLFSSALTRALVTEFRANPEPKIISLSCRPTIISTKSLFPNKIIFTDSKCYLMAMSSQEFSPITGFFAHWPYSWDKGAMKSLAKVTGNAVDRIVCTSLQPASNCVLWERLLTFGLLLLKLRISLIFSCFWDN